MKPAVLCITGWHFPEEFYRQVASLADADVYIVSHKKKRDVPGYIFDLFPPERVLFRPNLGYDWGCYQQFIASDYWKEYQQVVFLHDDLEIHDLGFVEQTAVMLEKYRVVGNGKGTGSVGQSSLKTHPYAYAHASWRPENYDFVHPTVRGSFFAITSADLTTLAGLEVYWDPLKISIEFGNWSTKASCAKMAGVFGESSFGYLSDQFGKSEYITEFVRGDQNSAVLQEKGIKGWLYSNLKRFSRVYVELTYHKKDLSFRFAWLWLLRRMLFIFSG